MFKYGVYSEAETKMLDAWYENSKAINGWLGADFDPVSGGVAGYTKADGSLLLMLARSHDHKNRLYWDSDYAKASRWGRPIAAPLYLESAARVPERALEVPAEVGKVLSEDCEQRYMWYAPVYEGDELHVRQTCQICDMTPDEEQDVRSIAISYNYSYYNRDNVLVGTVEHLYKTEYAAPHTPLRAKPEFDWMDEYVYTPEQVAQIDRLYALEPRRGRDTLFWEDVRLGEELPPVFLGPITAWDCMAALATSAETTLNVMDIRAGRAGAQMIVDPATNVSHFYAGKYIDSKLCRISGASSTDVGAELINPLFARLAASWMGDDGFLLSLNRRRLCATALGDTVAAKGRATGKRSAGGEHVVDIRAYIEDMRGYVTNICELSVALPCRSTSSGGDLESPPARAAFEIGERFRVKPRGEDWLFPCDYPLSGRTGVAVTAEDGYVTAILDDPSATVGIVGFREADIEKI